MSVYVVISFYPVDAILESWLKVAITKHFTAPDLTKAVWTQGPGAQFGARILAWVFEKSEKCMYERELHSYRSLNLCINMYYFVSRCLIPIR